MKLNQLIGVSSVMCLGLLPMAAQDGKDSAVTVEQLQKQLREMQQNFEKIQQQQHEQIESLTRQLNTLVQQKQIPSVAGTTNAPPATDATKQQIQELSDKVDQVAEAQKKTLLSEFNPAIGLVGETVFGYRTRGSDQTGSDRPGGFDVYQRSVELNLAASIDPFLKGYAVINASADSATGEAALGVEEAALQTTSLPGNLTLTAGRFFGEFGRLAYIHDHELPFVNRPLVLDRYIGGESKTDGLQVNWLLPTSHFINLTVGVGDQFGDDPSNPGTYRHFSEMNFWGRLSTYFDLTPNVSLELGASGLLNPSTEDRGGVLVQPDGSTRTERDRRLAGLDFKLSYTPLQDNQFKSFTWGNEILFSDSRYLFDPDGSLNPANPTSTPGWPVNSGDEYNSRVSSIGLYSYVAYKWSRQWSAGFLFDYAQSPENNRDQTYAYSPFVTYAISHWNQLRLQYTHTEHNAVSGLRPDDAIYLQWAWIIGAHSHGWQQR